MLELARTDDRTSINRIAGQCHMLHVMWRPDIFAVEEDLFPEPFFQDCIKERRLYAAKLHGVVVGYALIQQKRAEGFGLAERNVLILEQFAVEETCRSQGIGSVMMEDVLALARAFGCTDIQLGVQPENNAALALYRKFGFSVRKLDLQRKI